MNEITVSEFFAPDEEIEWNPPSEGITARDGTLVDVSGDIWRIPNPSRLYSINFGKLAVPQGDHLNSIKKWVAHNLRNKSAASACNEFNRAVAFFNTRSFVESAERRTEVPYLAFSEGIEKLSHRKKWEAFAFRSYYRWCCKQQFIHFNNEVLLRLEDVKIGGNAKGEAVRSADPDKGPLSAMEVAELAVALRAAYVAKSISVEKQAAIWLALAFGANAGQFALMREEDVVPEYVNGQLATTLVSVPRQKKRHAQARADFKTRKANRFVGRILHELILDNEARHPKNGSNGPRPLFRRALPREDGHPQKLLALRLLL